MDIATDSEISFAHSQYDTHAISGRLHAAPLVLREILATASAVCAKFADRGLHHSPDTWSLAQNAWTGNGGEFREQVAIFRNYIGVWRTPDMC